MAQLSSERQVNEAINREITHAEDKYGKYHVAMSRGDWLIVMEAEITEAKAALVRGDWEDAQREMLQVAAVAVNAIRYLGVSERD